METPQQQTSRIARMENEPSKKVHHKKILRTLELCPYRLTALGISKRCDLSYHQVSIRLKELRVDSKVITDERITDIDGKKRVSYKIK